MLVTLLLACGQPDIPEQQVGYRDGADGGATSGERGTVRITELLWSGTVHEELGYDPSDVFIELRNEGARPVNLSGWRLRVRGVIDRELRIPTNDRMVQVGEQVFIAAKSSRCFPDPDYVMPDLSFPNGDPFDVTLRDADERLMEGANDRDMAPFVGGYDLVSSRSMERAQLIFGGDGNLPGSWHFFNQRPCPDAVVGDDPANVHLSCFENEPNNQRILPACRRFTGASPGRANSPDYSGAFNNGSFE